MMMMMMMWMMVVIMMMLVVMMMQGKSGCHRDGQLYVQRGSESARQRQFRQDTERRQRRRRPNVTHLGTRSGTSVSQCVYRHVIATHSQLRVNRMSCVLEKRPPVFSHRRSIAERGGCFQRCLVCLSVCPHDNLRTTKRRTIKLGG